jgi:hypothetical protein
LVAAYAYVPSDADPRTESPPAKRDVLVTPEGIQGVDVAEGDSDALEVAELELDVVAEADDVEDMDDVALDDEVTEDVALLEDDAELEEERLDVDDADDVAEDDAELLADDDDEAEGVRDADGFDTATRNSVGGSMSAITYRNRSTAKELRKRSKSLNSSMFASSNSDSRMRATRPGSVFVVTYRLSPTCVMEVASP